MAYQRKRRGIEITATDCTSCMFIDNCDKTQPVAIGACPHWKLRLATWVPQEEL